MAKTSETPQAYQFGLPSPQQWVSNDDMQNNFLSTLRSLFNLNDAQTQRIQEAITDTYHSMAEDEFEKARSNGVKNSQADIIAKTIAEDRLTDSVYDKNYKNTVDSMEILGRDSNKLTFRNPNEGEKVGRQAISYWDWDGNRHYLTLLVPEKETVGYGNIRGWGSPENLEDHSYAPVTQAWGAMTQSTENRRKYPEGATASDKFGQNVGDTSFVLGLPITGALDLVAGNTISLNTSKNAKSKYTGEDKVVGLGNSGDSEGQVFGLIDEKGNEYGPKETQEFLSKLSGLTGYATRKPTFEQEHTGPAYVPGDILLGMLGLQPNRGAVGYSFPEYNYSDFVKNYRSMK